MKCFSERYGYEKVSEVIIREQITKEIENAICSAYDYLELKDYTKYHHLEEYLWVYFLNERKQDFNKYTDTATGFIKDSENPWYKKLDIIECTIQFLDIGFYTLRDSFVEYLNSEFARHNFAYRIIEGLVTETSSEEEISAIETALEVSENSVRGHLLQALTLYAQKPIGDYRNSIKESISAVEALSRSITGENKLHFKKMEEQGIRLPSSLRNAFEALYGYTNDKATGIRHALMDDVHAPEAEEALFMLVSCSAFVNYLTKKMSKTGK